MYQKEIVKAIRYLHWAQNPDKGIPATKPGAVSGCWTSGETLETLLFAPYHNVDPSPFAFELINYLELTQITTGKEKGGWPLVVGGKKSSTMATGHNVSALCLCKVYFRDNISLVPRLDHMIDAGIKWLDGNRNVDGGWGVEPSGGPDGNGSRMISTVYALRGYFAQEKIVDNSQTVRNGINWIIKCKNDDGGFGSKLGGGSDPCNTSRAIVALLRSKHCDKDSKVIKDGINYITRLRPSKKLWNLDTEIYVTEGAPGQTVYNSNTTADVLEAYIRAGYFNKHVEDLLKWFLDKQMDDGSWYLGANNDFVYEISTWSTNEALYAISVASKALVEKELPRISKQVKMLVRLCYSLALMAVFELLIIAKVPDYIQSGWVNLPENLKNLIIQGIFLSLLVNILSALLYDRLPWRKRPNKQKKNQDD